MSSDRNESVVSGKMPSEFNRLIGQLDGLNGVAKSGPSVKRITPMFGVGGTSSYSITTFRQAGEVISSEGEKEVRTPVLFTVFVEIVDTDPATGGPRAQQIVLPNDVAAIIARQREALTTASIRKSAKQAAQTRKDRGFTPDVKAMRAAREAKRKKGGKK